MSFRTFLTHASILAIAVVLTDSACAQAVPVPSSADASRLAHPTTSLTPSLTGKAQATGRPRFTQTPKPQNADQITLTLKGVKVTGTSVYASADLQKLWADDLGKKITLSEVYAIADRITKFYQDKGYILARAYIPAQEIDSGTVTIGVAEGQIGDIRVEGPFPVTGPLARAIADMRAQTPLEIKRVERWTLHLNDFYGAQFHVIFKNAADLKDPSIPADSVVLVLVGEKTKPVTAGISFDNSGSRYLGPNTVTATTALNYGDSHFQRTQLSYTTSTPTDELRVAAIEHDIPLNADGLQLQFDAQEINGFPGYSLKPLDIHSNTKQAGIGLEWTPVRQRSEVLTLKGKFDLQNSNTHIASQPFTDDHLRVFRISARYETLGDGAVNAAELRIDHGLDGVLGASKQNDLDLSRALGRPGFTKFGASLSRRQKLPWNLEISADATGQFSETPLLSSEEFGYGGNAFGRAYDPSEIVGDKGMAAALELRHDPWQFSYVDVQPFAFYDFGKVWNLDPGQAKTESGASAGFGARASTPYGLAASIALAKPLTKRIDTPQAYENDDGPRLQFNLTAKY